MRQQYTQTVCVLTIPIVCTKTGYQIVNIIGLKLSMNMNGQKVSFMVPNNNQLTFELDKCDKSRYDELVLADKDN